MAKKASKTKAKAPSRAVAAQQAAASLEAIFANSKQKKKAAASGGKKKGAAPAATAGGSPPSKRELTSFDQDLKLTGASQRRRTEEGWPIYTEEELGLGKCKNTKLCPFDCDCCF